MIWVGVGFVVLVVGVPGMLVFGTLRKIGRLTGTRWKVAYLLSYGAVLGSLIGLSNASSLGSSRWWLPLTVALILDIAVGLPLHFWSKRERARLPRNGSAWIPS